MDLSNLKNKIITILKKTANKAAETEGDSKKFLTVVLVAAVLLIFGATIASTMGFKKTIEVILIMGVFFFVAYQKK